MCKPLLRCQKITRLALIGPFDCSRWTDTAHAYHMTLFSNPELKEISLHAIRNFPLYLLQRSCALQTLSFDQCNEGSPYRLPELNGSMIEGGKKIILRKVKVARMGNRSATAFLQWISSPACFFDLGSLHTLEVPGPFGDQFWPEVNGPILAAIQLCTRQLVSLSIFNIKRK